MKINIDDNKKEPKQELERKEKAREKYKTPKIKSIPRKKRKKYKPCKTPHAEEGVACPSPSSNPDGMFLTTHQPEPSFSIEQLEKLLAERKQKELEMKNLQEQQLQMLALEQERLRLEAEKRTIEEEIRLENEKEAKERAEFLEQEFLVPIIPINPEVFDLCPICKKKTKKSKTKKNGNLVTQEIKCKNKLCNFSKIINLEL